MPGKSSFSDSEADRYGGRQYTALTQPGKFYLHLSLLISPLCEKNTAR